MLYELKFNSTPLVSTVPINNKKFLAENEHSLTINNSNKEEEFQLIQVIIILQNQPGINIKQQQQAIYHQIITIIQ